LKVFPLLLKKLLDKDFGDAFRKGFECMGICPLNLERVLSKLLEEQRNMDFDIQQQLLNKLSSIRYSPGPTTKVPRPKKKDKLPAGAPYTCSAEGGVVVLPDDEDDIDRLPMLPKAMKRARQQQPTGDVSSSEECSSNEASSSDKDYSGDKVQSSSNNEEVSSSEEIGATVERWSKKKEKKQKRDQERWKQENEESSEMEKDEHQYLPGHCSFGISGGSLVVTPDCEAAVLGSNPAISPAYRGLPVLRWAAIWDGTLL
jgi:hypothetical protein